jgi:hypothetical protein
MDQPQPGSRRILFLDDDRQRALAFLTTCPEAVWVETAEECLARLQEPWDEVHLDHDLGGKTFVDHEREDCGMEVVRWLCEEFRSHLRETRFIVHTHNPQAACLMTLHLQVTGYRVEDRPFGARLPGQSAPRPAGPLRDGLIRLIRWLGGRG